MSSKPLTTQMIADSLGEHIDVIQHLANQESALEKIGERMYTAIAAGKKILWCGNGGSAADCQHLAAELVGRFVMQRRAIASIALTTDTSILTAVANDFGYAHIFRRQVEALCQPGDILVGISTSGNSENVCAAVVSAAARGAYTVAMTGKEGGRLATLADISLRVESSNTCRVQEAHIVAGHILCELIEHAIMAVQPCANEVGCEHTSAAQSSALLLRSDSESIL